MEVWSRRLVIIFSMELCLPPCQMAVRSGSGGPASTVRVQDDVISVETLLNGTIDAIKMELEVLPTVGEVMRPACWKSRRLETYAVIIGAQRSNAHRR